MNTPETEPKPWEAIQGETKNLDVGRVCIKCGNTKSVNEFVPLSRPPFRPSGVCRVCALIRRRQIYDPEKNRQRLVRMLSNPVKKAEIIKRWNKNAKSNPEHYRANMSLKRALKNGTLSKPRLCSNCKLAHKNIDGHHPDYSKHLEVIWLCRPCHMRLHHGLISIQ